MSITIYSGAEEVSQMASVVGFCFVDQAKTLERLIDRPCGMSSVVSDEVYIDAVQFANFTHTLVTRIEQTNNGQFAALCIGPLQICLFLLSKMNMTLPDVPDRLLPVLEGSQTLRSADWNIVALQNDEEEIALRQGAPRSNQNWVVYHRKPATGEDPQPDHEHLYAGLNLLAHRRFEEAATTFREYAQRWNTKEGYYYLGVSLLFGGNTAEARDVSQKTAHAETDQPISSKDKKFMSNAETQIARMDASQ